MASTPPSLCIFRLIYPKSSFSPFPILLAKIKLAAVVLIVFCSAVLPPLREAWRRVRAKSRTASAVFAAGAIATIIYAGTKPTARVTWDEYFSNKSYSIDTNDLRRISFAWTAPAWMPETANAILNAYSRTAGIPDVEAVTNAPMSTGAMSAVMPYESTNYVYFVACDWTPAPAVVTNGVYHVRLYSRALTAAEIAHNYAIDKAKFNLP